MANSVRPEATVFDVKRVLVVYNKPYVLEDVLSGHIPKILIIY